MMPTSDKNHYVFQLDDSLIPPGVSPSSPQVCLPHPLVTASLQCPHGSRHALQLLLHPGEGFGTVVLEAHVVDDMGAVAAQGIPVNLSLPMIADKAGFVRAEVQSTLADQVTLMPHVRELARCGM